MKRLHISSALFLILSILPACRQPFHIYTINSFSYLEKSIDHLEPNALVIFDIDETLFSLTPEVDGQASPLDEQLRKTVSEHDRATIEEKMNKIVPLVIEPRVVDMINRLQKRGIKVIALTAGGHGTSNQIMNLTQYRIHLLHSIGIHFEKSFPHQPAIQFLDLAQNGYVPLFFYGVLFSQPSTKGIVLAAFLKALGLNPIIYYFDNLEGQVVEIAQTAEQMNIPGAGFIYNGFKNITPDAIRAYNQKLRFLFINNSWLPDDDAKWLLKDAED